MKKIVRISLPVQHITTAVWRVVQEAYKEEPMGLEGCVSFEEKDGVVYLCIPLFPQEVRRLKRVMAAEVRRAR
jgi:hypothetical protein